jgi:two-component system response regulator QseB
MSTKADILQHDDRGSAEMERMSILVVEDDPNLNRAIVMLFTIIGWNAIGVETVADAISALRGRFNLVLLDLMLPDGTGVDVIEYIRKEKIKAKVIVTTGATDSRLINDAKAFAPDEILMKPAHWDKIMSFAAKLVLERDERSYLNERYYNERNNV